jgi:hypothetical protein
MMKEEQTYLCLDAERKEQEKIRSSEYEKKKGQMGRDKSIFSNII